MSVLRHCDCGCDRVQVVDRDDKRHALADGPWLTVTQHPARDEARKATANAHTKAMRESLEAQAAFDRGEVPDPVILDTDALYDSLVRVWHFASFACAARGMDNMSPTEDSKGGL